ncbi:MAG: DUF3891 family protein [Balneolaceae bacterium]|nr:MAG: DUF3891 family protein [Balneolaceae bacterium]
MVIREQNNHWLLITQPAHAWISGQIAENWGGDGFARPPPWKELCFAAARHDDGWTGRDIQPEWNAGTRLPYDFKNIPIDDHMTIWKQSAAIVEHSSRFAALLVSRHIMGLFSMHDFSREPESIRLKADHFKKQQHALQKRLIADLEYDGFCKSFIHDNNLEQHRRLLSAFDYLSLFLILGESDAAVLDDIPAHQGGKSLEDEPKKVRLSRRGTPAKKLEAKISDTWVVSPWPFRHGHVSLRCDAILLEKRCAHQKELDRALQQSRRELFAVGLVPEP